jgi:hypothetical protein
MVTRCISATLLHRLTAVPVTDWILWLGSLALTMSLVVLLRTRWGQSRPLQKCAVLSLLVHALLACLAMTIRVVVGEGGGGTSGAPIRVRIVQDSGEQDGNPSVLVDPVAASAPQLFEPPENEVEAAATEELATDEQFVEAPQLMEPPRETNEPAIVELIPAEESHGDVSEVAARASASEKNVDHATTDADTESAADAIPADAAAPVVAASPDVEVSTQVPNAVQEAASTTQTAASSEVAAAAPSSSAPYSLRNAPGRLGLVQLQGGSTETEAAVVAALAWLAKAQSADGRWDANRYGAGQEQTVLGHNRGGAGRNADTGISALALLAFLGAGHSHQQGDYQETVRRGLEFLLRSQAGDGSLFGESTLYAQMYCHSMATFALAEAQAMTGDHRIQPAVEKAVEFSLHAQHPATGGWRYRPAVDVGDTSQLGWQMMALASAQRAGIDVPAHTWTRVGRFLRSVRRGQYGGLASYRPDGPPSTSMTAEAFYCRALLQEIRGEPIDQQAVDEATKAVLASLPARDRINLYYWYYASLALHQRQQTSDGAAAAWDAWNGALCEALVSTQQTQGDDAGSWNTNTVWGGYGGRVYTTAMAAMCLEVYYRYAPTSRTPSMATRPDDPERR